MPDEAEAKVSQKRKVGRSPAYPSFSIQKAVEKAKALYDREGDYSAPLPSATAAWGYSEKSSGGRQTLATMRYYGLIDVIGDGDTRKVKISETARRILLDQREDTAEKWKLIRKAALTPTAHQALYKQYPTGLASDGTVIHFLVFDEGFNKSAAEELLAEFKDTAKFISLYDPAKNVDKPAPESNTADCENAPRDIAIGDRIQWVNQGVLQFPNGAKVLGFSDDNQWVFTDQGSSGVPLKEVTLMETPAPTPARPVVAPPMPAHLAASLTVAQNRNTEDARQGSRKAVFPVGDGDVTLIFPENISADGLDELDMYLNIFLKKEQKRRQEGN